MLSPVALATWISLCTPWAEPRLLTALVVAGSAGDPYLITDAADKPLASGSPKDALRVLRQLPAGSEAYIGLTQLPVSKLAALGLHPEAALDPCGNLEVGYQLLLNARAEAGKVEKSPWKTVSVAYSLYRSGKAVIDGPFARKATDHLMKGTTVAPAPLGSPLRYSILAEWSAGLAMREAARYGTPRPAPLVHSLAVARWARSQY